MKFNSLFFKLTCLMLFLLSCQTNTSLFLPTTNQVHQSSETDSFGYSKSDVRAKTQRILNKPKSSNPITLGISPGLLSNKPLRETTGVFNTDSFQIRGVQEPLWRYSQIFMSGQDILTINLPDIITDLAPKKWTPEKRGLHLTQRVKNTWVRNTAKNSNWKPWLWPSKWAALKLQEA